jgi:putative ABC transport system ATP-binding protein
MLIERLGLATRRHHRPQQLSTGERQRVALARAMLNQPPLLLADEPTGNLDRANADIVLGELTAFKEQGGSVMLVTHDRHAAGFADRQVNLRAGMLEPAAT